MRPMRGLMVCSRLDMSSLECNFGWIDDLCMKGRQVPPVARRVEGIVRVKHEKDAASGASC